jgi:hypothetical protein
LFQLCLEFEERPNLLFPPVRPYDEPKISLRVKSVPNSFAIANYEPETPADAVMGNIHVAGWIAEFPAQLRHTYFKKEKFWCGSAKITG